MNRSFNFCFITLLLAFASINVKAAPIRITENICTQWKFNLGDIPGAKNPEFDDSKWRILNLPHDWSIEGAFSEKNPATR